MYDTVLVNFYVDCSCRQNFFTSVLVPFYIAFATYKPYLCEKKILDLSVTVLISSSGCVFLML